MVVAVVLPSPKLGDKAEELDKPSDLRSTSLSRPRGAMPKQADETRPAHSFQSGVVGLNSALARAQPKYPAPQVPPFPR